ncbi:YoaK family protein [Sphingomonas abietis]|uniref:YoaK family protein n=1 Tax=Sphingomonas abietis TaxID=3012344 RepID=A0ABY7NIT8_9SPHN|nr:YoaK family protein [Sphingomonas abietis]WBO21447.1 YoaK family protein [Sphingomonas abietis]
MIDVSTPDRKATVLLLLAIAGCVDAVGLAETGRYFVSFMSGNTTQMALHLAYRDYASVGMPLGLIALFVAGCTIGTLIAEKVGGRLAGGMLLLVEAIVLAVAAWGFQSPWSGIGLILLPVGMGLANIVTLHAGSAQPGATHATGALVKLGILLAGAGRDARAGDLGFQLAMWIALLVGGILGAFGRLRFGMDTLLAAAGLLLVLGVVDLLLSRRRAV